MITLNSPEVEVIFCYLNMSCLFFTKGAMWEGEVRGVKLDASYNVTNRQPLT